MTSVAGSFLNGEDGKELKNFTIDTAILLPALNIGIERTLKVEGPGSQGRRLALSCLTVLSAALFSKSLEYEQMENGSFVTPPCARKSEAYYFMQKLGGQCPRTQLRRPCLKKHSVL